MASPNTIFGNVHYIGVKEEVKSQRTGNSIFKRELYLLVERRDPDTNEVIHTSYPKFEFTNNRCDILDKFQQGQRVAVIFNVDGRFFETKDKDAQGNVIYGHMNSITGREVLTMEEYKQRYGRNNSNQQQNGQNNAATSQPSMAQVLNNQPQGGAPVAPAFLR